MKKAVINIMFFSSTILLSLAIYELISGIEIIFNRTIFEVILVNIVIQAGLFFTRKFESKYAILEYVVDFGYILLVICGFGFLFSWFSYMPIWILIIITILIYILGNFIFMVRIQKNANRINKLLKMRKSKKNIVS